VTTAPRSVVQRAVAPPERKNELTAELSVLLLQAKGMLKGEKREREEN